MKNVTRKVEKLHEKEVEETFRREMEKCLCGYDLEQMEELEDVSKVFRSKLYTACETVLGVRRRGKGIKGTAWWNEEVKKLWKTKSHTEIGWGAEEIEMLRGSRGRSTIKNGSERQRGWLWKARRVDEKFGRNLSRKEVQKVKGGVRGDRKRVENKDGKMLLDERKWRDGWNILMTCLIQRMKGSSV